MMEKDRQDLQRKKQKALLRLVDPRRDAKMVRPSAKGALRLRRCPYTAPTLATKSSSSPRVTETTVSGTEGMSQELSVDDYLVDGVTMFDA